MQIQFLGQSTFKILTSSGVSILTDPWFGNLFFLRTTPPFLKPHQIKNCNLMLVSHNHLDHFDKAALKLAKKNNSYIIGSESVVRRAKKEKIKKTVNLTKVKNFKYKDVEIIPTPAFHPFTKDALGFLIKIENKILYFSGDTLLNRKLINFLNGYKIYLAFLQIACAVYFGFDDGLNIYTASSLVKIISPKIVAPMHYHIKFKEENPYKLYKKLTASKTQIEIFNLGEIKKF